MKIHLAAALIAAALLAAGCSSTVSGTAQMAGSAPAVSDAGRVGTVPAPASSTPAAKKVVVTPPRKPVPPKSAAPIKPQPVKPPKVQVVPKNSDFYSVYSSIDGQMVALPTGTVVHKPVRPGELDAILPGPGNVLLQAIGGRTTLSSSAQYDSFVAAYFKKDSISYPKHSPDPVVVVEGAHPGIHSLSTALDSASHPFYTVGYVNDISWHTLALVTVLVKPDHETLIFVVVGNQNDYRNVQNAYFQLASTMSVALSRGHFA